MFDPKSLKYIVTHPGQAHRDEFMAIAFLLAMGKYGLRIFRRQPTAAELNDPQVAVVDVGLQDDPDRSNFDHHQYGPGAPITSSLSLVLRALGILDFAKEILPWITLTEILDVKGPGGAAKHIGTSVDKFMETVSPVETYALRSFQENTEDELAPGSMGHTLARNVGNEYVGYLDKVSRRLAVLRISQVFTINELSVLDLRMIPANEEPTLAVELFCKAHLPDVAITVSNDDRGPGLSLYRRNDHPLVDFTRITTDPRVTFAHLNGFIAKTKKLPDDDSLFELLEKATVSEPVAVPGSDEFSDQEEISLDSNGGA